MCRINLGEPVPMIEKNATTSCLLEISWVFFLFHNKLYESQQERHLPKAVIPGEFSLLSSIRSVLAVDSTLNY